MKVRFDRGEDALYIRLDEAPVAESLEVSPGVVLDFDAANRVIGIEVLNAQSRLPDAELGRMQFEVA
jgi:uncharacterized protein YuzE